MTFGELVPNSRKYFRNVFIPMSCNHAGRPFEKINAAFIHLPLFPDCVC